MAEREKTWWEKWVVGTDGTSLNQSAPSEIDSAESTPPEAWTGQYLVEGQEENAEDKSTTFAENEGLISVLTGSIEIL